MSIDEEKIDEVVLALLHLKSFKDGEIKRSWKSYDWSVLDRLHEKGFISNPKSKSKPVVLSETGAQQAEKLISKYFSKAG
jgi:hypothetical protein